MFSFDPTGFTSLDRVRAALGDRNAADPWRSNEEITGALERSGTTGTAITVDEDAENAAVRILASGLLSEYANKPTSFSKSGKFSISWGNRLEAWDALAKGTVVGIGLGVGASSTWGAPVWMGTGTFSRPDAEG